MGARVSTRRVTVSLSRLFAMMNPIWRTQGWGQPGVGPNGVVHYAYAAQGVLSTGDIMYTRSTDNGNTWSTPIVLNDPETNQYQSHWMPSLSVNYSPSAFRQPQDVTVSWYDRRQATSPCNNVGDPGCNYQRFGVQSSNNGASWGSNIEISDIIIPQPAQEDPDFPACYAGDYDYATASEWQCLRDLDRRARRGAGSSGAERGVCQPARTVGVWLR